jgi:hypothetical protein
MSLYKFFKTDPKAEAQGNLFTLQGPDGKPVFRVMLRRAGGANDLLDRVRERVFAPYRRVIDSLQPKVKSEMTHRVFAEAVTIPGTFETYERDGIKCQGNEFKDGKWEPETPNGRTADGFVRGLCNEQDEIIPDTIDNIVAMFNALPEVFGYLIVESSSSDSYKYDHLEQDSKN